MSVLSDRSLRVLYPEADRIGPASIDLCVGEKLRIWPDYVRRDARVNQSALWRPVLLERDGAWVLKPGYRYLTTTAEDVVIRPDTAGQIGARSSWARDGLSVIQGPAGWLDPGYEGRPTLELSVVGSELVLWPGAAICQLIVFRLTTPCETPYAGKYQGDLEPTPSRLFLEHVREDVHNDRCNGCGSPADAMRMRQEAAHGR